LMLRTAQSLPQKGLSTLPFDAGRFPPTSPACYRATWQLAATRTGLTPASDDELTTKDHLQPVTSSLLSARRPEGNPQDY
jgi:hypothetical protein